MSAARPPLFVLEEGAGPELVLLHGGYGSWTHWNRNITALAERFHVRAFDLPGFGSSPDVPEDLGSDGYFRWVADEILKGGDGPFSLVGFSFGGSIAAGAAPLLGPHLASLTLVAPGSFGEPRGRNLNRDSLGRPIEKPRDARPAARYNLMTSMLVDPDSADDVTVSLHLLNVQRARFTSRKISWQDRLFDDLAPVRCPIQMIWGARDILAVPSLERRVAFCRAARPEIRVDLVPEAGHWVQHERPAAFNALLLDFLSDAAAGRARRVAAQG